MHPAVRVPAPPLPVDYSEYQERVKDIPLAFVPQCRVFSSAEYLECAYSKRTAKKFTPSLRAYSWDPYGVRITESDVDRAKQWYKRTIKPIFEVPQQLLSYIELVRKQQLSRKKQRRKEEQHSRRQLAKEEKRIRQAEHETKAERQEREDVPELRCEQDPQSDLLLQEGQQHQDPQQHIYSSPLYSTALPPQQPPYSTPMQMMPRHGQHQSQGWHSRHHNNAPPPLGYSEPYHGMSRA